MLTDYKFGLHTYVRYSNPGKYGVGICSCLHPVPAVLCQIYLSSPHSLSKHDPTESGGASQYVFCGNSKIEELLICTSSADTENGNL